MKRAVMPAGATSEKSALRSPTPLRGRDEELGRIGERLSAERSSIGSVVTVAGDPGLGKTRLLEEAARITRRIGVRFTYAAADPSESVVPLSSLMTALFEGGDPLLDWCSWGSELNVDEWSCRSSIPLACPRSRLVLASTIRAGAGRAAASAPETFATLTPVGD